MKGLVLGHLFSLSFVYLYFLFISHISFKSDIWLLIALVPVRCFSITCVNRIIDNIKHTKIVVL